MIFNRLIVLRAEHSVSRAALAEATGVNAQTIGFIERGDYYPSLELAFKLATYFELPLEAVFSDGPFRKLSHEVYGKKEQSHEK